MKQFCLAFIFLSQYTFTGICQQNDKNIIIWNEGIHLKINDFIIVNDSSAKIDGDKVAVSRTGVTYSLTTKDKARMLEINVFATFHKSNSFIKKKVLKAPESVLIYLLNHEQGHFNISEIFARKAVKELQKKQLHKNYAAEINQLIRKIFASAEAMQRVYDSETTNGVNEELQKEWDKKISTELANLSIYSNKKISKTR